MLHLRLQAHCKRFQIFNLQQYYLDVIYTHKDFELFRRLNQSQICIKSPYNVIPEFGSLSIVATKHQKYLTVHQNISQSSLCLTAAAIHFRWECYRVGNESFRGHPC